jgi:hypothetical protein
VSAAWPKSPAGARVDTFRLLLLCLLVLSLSSAAWSRNPQAELRQGAEQFVSLLESKDVATLMNLFSEQGTSFIGTGYVPSKASLTQQEIREAFEGKTGVYCLFFDTKCLSEEDSKERSRRNGRPLSTPVRSLLDLIAGAKTKRFVTYDNMTNGKVTLLLSNRTPDTARLGDDALNFYFTFEQGQWKLRNVEYN